MLLELGNHSAAHSSVIDDRPKITTIHIPEFDDGSHHPDALWEHEQGQFKRGDAPNGVVPEGAKCVQVGTPLGGYTHEVGKINVADFKDHLMESLLSRQGITQLPGNETLVSILHPTDGLMPHHFAGKPTWVKASAHDLTPDGVAADIEKFLTEFWGCPSADDFFGTSDPEEQLVKKELQYWTRTPPGEFPGGPSLPAATALYLDQGRVISNLNDGGGQVGLAGTGTAATATTLTTGTSMTTNAWAGYRVYVMQTASGPIIWGNVLSNTSGGVLTVDRWYSAATPGGSAPSAPSAGWQYILADGGAVSTWFVALTTTNITPVHGDNNLSGEYTTASGGMIRKIAPYAQTSGVASRSLTLTPVYTANGSDTVPSTFYAIGVFAGMVVTASSPYTPFKFETSLNASATINLSGDQVTVTETVTGS